jgi:hypothetical protein
MKHPLFGLFACSIFLTSCVSLESYTEPGIQAVERRALRHSMYDDNNPLAVRGYLARAMQGDSAALHTFFAESVSPGMDGERSELYTFRLEQLLFVLGDRRFAAALSREAPAIRHRIGSRLIGLQTQWHLHYPGTKATLTPN